jgi:putative component of membrane protein insertase Oxa1/YidC/SpoIIIJ protein YidD
MYGYDAIARFGVIKGGGMTLWRVARCNPFNKGGIDEVPPAPPKSTISNKTP